MQLARQLLTELLGQNDEDATHMHVVGSSGLGKSKFVEYLFREALLLPSGIAVIDWSGKLYRELAGYIAALQPHRDIYILNPSDTEFVTAYNPFTNPTADDVGTTVNRFIKLAVTPWDQPDTNRTPTIEKVSRVLFHFMLAAGETLPNAALLIDEVHGKQVAKFADGILDISDHQTARRKMRELLAENQTPKQWKDTFQSTDSRITRYLDPRGFERLIGFREESLNIADIVNSNAILLVNLSQTGSLDADMARSLACFLLNDLLVAAERRRGTNDHFLLFLDEFQQYMSVDMASMLDQVRGGGLRLVLSHQHLGHLVDDAHLRKSVMTNARIKVAFGGLDYEDAAFMAHEIYLAEINRRHVVKTFKSQRVARHELTRVPTLSMTDGTNWSHTDSHSEGEGGGSNSGTGQSASESDDGRTTAGERSDEGSHDDWSSSNTSSDTFGGSHAETRGEAVLLIPEYEEHVTSEVERSRDDRIGYFAAKLKLSEGAGSSPSRQMRLFGSRATPQSAPPAEEKAAYATLELLWSPMAERESRKQSQNRPFFDVPDFFPTRRGRGDTNIGNFP